MNGLKIITKKSSNLSQDLILRVDTVLRKVSSKAAAPDTGTSAPLTAGRFAKSSPAVPHTAVAFLLRMIRLGAYFSSHVRTTWWSSNTDRRRLVSTVCRARDLK